MSLDPAATIASPEHARAVIGEIDALIDSLSGLMRDEAGLVRAGKLKDAAALAEPKREAMQRYARLLPLLKREARALDRFAADAVFDLRRRHAAFNAELKTNLAVLATARAVAEGLVRSVANAVGASTGAATYGARGAMPAAAGGSARGIAINRSL